jgi:hypothetical protein
MLAIAVVAGVLAIAFIWFKLIRSVRDRSMRSLASTLGFQYMDRALPACFPSDAEPFDKISLTWNVLRGIRKDIEIVVFDGIFGEGRGIYRTYIAARTTKDPFPKDESVLDNVLQSAGWTVLFGSQPALNLIPWSLSSRRIEEYLNRLVF